MMANDSKMYDSIVLYTCHQLGLDCPLVGTSLVDPPIDVSRALQAIEEVSSQVATTLKKLQDASDWEQTDQLLKQLSQKVKEYAST